MFSVQRWFTIRALFMLCLRFYTYAYSSDVNNKQSPSISLPKRVYPVNKVSPARWATSVLRDEVSATSRLENIEPGFDFTEEEMVKLKIWPGGVIPYYIDEFSFDKVFRDRIRTFLDGTSGITGLNFLELLQPPEDKKSRWVLFINRQGLLSCADHSIKDFTNEGVQKVLLGYDCLTTGGELAEAILALVGVPPQHNAPNRNEHVTIEKTNIMPDKAYLFEVLKDDEWLFHDVEYDFSSAGHYPLHKYTVNGMATIEPLDEVTVNIGEGTGFSYTDIWKIRMIYNFISKKRVESVNAPECNKLFNVGSNFSNFEPDSEDDIQPRKKPNKYLGLPEDKQVPQGLPSDNPKPDETETATQNSNKKSDETVSSIEEEEPEKEKDKVLSVMKPKNKKVVSGERNSVNKENPLFVFSDYNTEEEYAKNRYDRKFTRPGGKRKVF